MHHLGHNRGKQRVGVHTQGKAKLQWRVFCWEDLEAGRSPRSGGCERTCSYIYRDRQGCNRLMQSLVFEVTPSASTYKWQADDAIEQTKFVASLIKLFQFVTGGAVPLRLIGVKAPDHPSCTCLTIPRTLRCPHIIAAAPKGQPPFTSTRMHRMLNTSDSTLSQDELSTPTSGSPRSTTPVKPGPPIVIWKRPIDVSQLPPIPPTPMPARPG